MSLFEKYENRLHVSLLGLFWIHENHRMNAWLSRTSKNDLKASDSESSSCHVAHPRGHEFIMDRSRTVVTNMFVRVDVRQWLTRFLRLGLTSSEGFPLAVDRVLNPLSKHPENPSPGRCAIHWVISRHNRQRCGGRWSREVKHSHCQQTSAPSGPSHVQ